MPLEPAARATAQRDAQRQSAPRSPDSIDRTTTTSRTTRSYPLPPMPSYGPLPAAPTLQYIPTPTPPASAAPRNPHEDPQYLAFQRAAGQSEADLRGQNALQSSMLLRGAERQLPNLRENTAEQMRNIGLSATARGVFGSGTRARDQNLVSLRGARAENDILQGAREQVALMELDLARALAGLNREGAEQDVDARTRLALGAAGVGLR